LHAELDVLMAGRAAEELVFGRHNVSTGCASDLQQATKQAQRMVKQAGMGGGASNLSMHYSNEEYKVLSDQVKNEIDTQIRVVLANAYDRAVQLLQRNVDKLHMLAEALMEYETLDREEVRLATKGMKGEILARRAGGKKKKEKTLLTRMQEKGYERKNLDDTSADFKVISE
jgi:ATP-dependent Zn protease